MDGGSSIGRIDPTVLIEGLERGKSAQMAFLLAAAHEDMNSGVVYLVELESLPCCSNLKSSGYRQTDL